MRLHHFSASVLPLVETAKKRRVVVCASVTRTDVLKLAPPFMACAGGLAVYVNEVGASRSVKDILPKSPVISLVPVAACQ